MDFRLADTFTDALARLPSQDQKAVKVSVLDLQLDSSHPGLHMHRIEGSKDPNFWSARVNRDLRLILHKTASSLLVAYVGHHDEAYAWAERRRIEAHPKTGAIQIVEVRERVEKAQPDFAQLWIAPEPETPVAPALFKSLTADELLAAGVPEDWVFPVQAATEASFFELAEMLPAEASEALLEYAATGVLARAGATWDPFAAPAPAPDPYQHPDARRRFFTVESADALRAALDAPWDKWSVFLHPSQKAVVERVYNGPARVSGSAGTGKTVVALHRAVRASQARPDARVLLTTFSEPLAQSLSSKLKVLAGFEPMVVPRVMVTSFEALAIEHFQLAFGRKPRVASDAKVAQALADAAESHGLKGFSRRFLVAEWQQVIDAWRVSSADDYASVPRLGRKNRLGARQRDQLWPVFEAAAADLKAQALSTWSGVFHALADYHAARPHKPYTHVIVDEAQDLSVAQLRLMGALVSADQPDSLFFAGDLGQRIFQQPFSWKALGADVRGRSTTLKVNYRTSQQIRELADDLLPAMVRDVDGREEERKGTISVFEGPAPEVAICANPSAEYERVATFLRAAAADGVRPEQMGVFVRSVAELPRAREAIGAAGFKPFEISERQVEADGLVAMGVMHLAKGLEFKAVAVMACDDDVLPLAERINAIVEPSDLDEVFETERHLLYVACTRARDRLLVTGAKPASEFLVDLLARLAS